MANTLSLLELVEMLNRKFGRKLHCSFEDWRPGDQPVFISSIGKAHADFGWQPRVGVEEGVGRLIEWIKANDMLFEPEKQRAYTTVTTE